MRKLYWFRQDLRLDDNPGLLAQADADGLLLVYIWPQNRPWCNVTGAGAQMERFMTESLQALREGLQALGQDLMVLHGSPELVIPDLVRENRARQRNWRCRAANFSVSIQGYPCSTLRRVILLRSQFYEFGKCSINLNALRFWLFFLALCLLSLFTTLWLRGGTDATPFEVLHSLTESIESWLSGSEAEQSAIGSPAHSNSPAALPISETRPYELDSRTKVAPSDHTAGDQQVCSRPRTKSRTNTESKLIYKWVDEEGQVNMADSTPEGVIASVLDIGMKKRDFTYKVIADGVAVPPDYQGQLSAGSKRIYDTWHFFLGEKKLRQSQIEVRLIGGHDRFNAYHASVSPNSKPVNGFYSMSKNQAVVKYDPQHKQQAIRTTFHEVSHLITASHLGPTPPWLTEGLAEYFENMQVKGQSAAIPPNQNHIKLLRKTPLPRLKDYLSIERPEWHGKNRDQNYAIAWSLIHFLLQGSPGMYALQSVIQKSEQKFCKSFSTIEALDQAYPGGLQRLESDWKKWLATKKYRAHQT
jgi:hypothetical protein